jgi:hypothetical protein
VVVIGSAPSAMAIAFCTSPIIDHSGQAARGRGRRLVISSDCPLGIALGVPGTLRITASICRYFVDLS